MATKEEIAQAFQLAKKFKGQRAGWCFKTGKYGTGYYRDHDGADKPPPPAELAELMQDLGYSCCLNAKCFGEVLSQFGPIDAPCVSATVWPSLTQLTLMPASCWAWSPLLAPSTAAGTSSYTII